MHVTAAAAINTVQFGINWYPEIRGITVVMIAVTVLCGSVYMLLGTNLGGRLGFLVALTGLFGWLMLMGGVWAIYGIGLKGPEPKWVPKETIVGVDTHDAVTSVARDLTRWNLLASDNGGYGQANAASDDILTSKTKQSNPSFSATSEYKTIKVYDYGGERFPKFGIFDQIAFFHTPHYAIVEVAPVVAQSTEPGKAPPTAVIDSTKPHFFVLMEKDLGYRRFPAFVLFFSAGGIFSLLCYVLHSRDKLAMARTGKLPALTQAGA
jgi:hypothetical protein